MGKIVVAASVSVDGMFEGPEADLSWPMVDSELHGHFNEMLFPAGALLDGRVTHEMMAAYWPTADQQPDAPEEEKAYAAFWRVAPKYVLSTTLPDTGEWNVTVLRSLDPVAMRALADSVDGDMFIGGGKVIDSFRRADLIDEWRIYTHPVILGAGRPLLSPGESMAHVTLLGTRTFGNGVVLTHYAADRTGG
jgi:dihydrofolate reductase